MTVAESYSFQHSNIPPPLVQLNLTAPKGVRRPDWNPIPPHTRPLTVTASICLDFASPNAFSSLDGRPALILGPARTWHTDVSKAMWAQASARAEEVGSTLLWCDGGESGISGVSGNGVADVIQVGEGYWLRKIGVKYPFDAYTTIYAKIGDFGVVAITWIIMLDMHLTGLIIAGRKYRFSRRQMAQWLHQKLQDCRNYLRFRRARANPETTPLLVDA